ncbi:hypothetical protein L2E82_10427 [Cichorium intybus]|uniref:Uncharacterized protein n=1 Tax=Cichorium intybus TaxID=13427 RepID=A0ACB9GBQ9_CICIN|nr:hypothetical protein L2E82_10427 [Cichorium intybus]
MQMRQIELEDSTIKHGDTVRGGCDRKRDRSARTGRPGGGRNKAVTTADDDRRMGEGSGGSPVAVKADNGQKGTNTSSISG